MPLSEQRKHLGVNLFNFCPIIEWMKVMLFDLGTRNPAVATKVKGVFYAPYGGYVIFLLRCI